MFEPIIAVMEFPLLLWVSLIFTLQVFKVNDAYDQNPQTMSDVCVNALITSN